MLWPHHHTTIWHYHDKRTILWRHYNTITFNIMTLWRRNIMTRRQLYNDDTPRLRQGDRNIMMKTLLHYVKRPQHCDEGIAALWGEERSIITRRQVHGMETATICQTDNRKTTRPERYKVGTTTLWWGPQERDGESSLRGNHNTMMRTARTWRWDKCTRKPNIVARLRVASWQGEKLWWGCQKIVTRYFNNMVRRWLHA